ncbi:MAG: triose-phosphate isomerase [Elusimicrobia bacterium]|nr:triose-phosphate isomerase [Elusimicrobiota bacterium]
MSKRTPLIAGNWKMHNGIGESVELAKLIKQGVGKSAAEVLIAPSYISLKEVCRAVAGSKVFIAAQDCCWEDKGAFTGAVSPSQIKDAGCTHVILGHSEKRKIFGDTDEIINKKIKAALSHGLVPIFCVGETLAERESSKTCSVLKEQIVKGLSGFTAEQLSSLIIAYEPVWAIGTGKTATPEQAQETHQYIRKLAGELFGESFSAELRILYGGSVKPENIDGIMAQPDVDGTLVGGESLKAERFLRIVNFIQ